MLKNCSMAALSPCSFCNFGIVVAAKYVSKASENLVSGIASPFAPIGRILCQDTGVVSCAADQALGIDSQQKNLAMAEMLVLNPLNDEAEVATFVT
ncbi:hypothetical protein [Celeribacter baekdonensis]|uniref:hypothetical protein n=1 Tax=Celeribacter baekdonensis TaxID=875171 RepID=UPI00131F053B|nr:hypothetical protein [Celeribacter baekdonensis]